MRIKYHSSPSVVIKYSSKERKRKKKNGMNEKKSTSTQLFSGSLLARCGLDPSLLLKWRYDLEDEWARNLSPWGKINSRRKKKPSGKIYGTRIRTITYSFFLKKRDTFSSNSTSFGLSVYKNILLIDIGNKTSQLLIVIRTLNSNKIVSIWLKILILATGRMSLF